MAFPLGANGAIYNMLFNRYGHAPTVSEYNQAVQWINASSGTNYPLFTETALAPPPAGGGGGALFTGTGAGGTSPVMNPQERQNQWDQALQAQDEAAALARQQVASAAQTGAAQISAQAQLEAQRQADRAALERLRYQLGQDLATALMQNDQKMFERTMKITELAADPRSTVGFLEYLARSGGGPTAISQNVSAGITPSPVWDYVPLPPDYGPEIQALIDQLRDFIGG